MTQTSNPTEATSQTSTAATDPTLSRRTRRRGEVVERRDHHDEQEERERPAADRPERHGGVLRAHRLADRRHDALGQRQQQSHQREQQQAQERDQHLQRAGPPGRPGIRAMDAEGSSSERREVDGRDPHRGQQARTHREARGLVSLDHPARGVRNERRRLDGAALARDLLDGLGRLRMRPEQPQDSHEGRDARYGGEQAVVRELGGGSGEVLAQHPPDRAPRGAEHAPHVRRWARAAPGGAASRAGTRLRRSRRHRAASPAARARRGAESPRLARARACSLPRRRP